MSANKRPTALDVIALVNRKAEEGAPPLTHEEAMEILGQKVTPGSREELLLKAAAVALRLEPPQLTEAEHQSKTGFRKKVREYIDEGTARRRGLH